MEEEAKEEEVKEKDANLAIWCSISLPPKSIQLAKLPKKLSCHGSKRKVDIFVSKAKHLEAGRGEQ